MKRPTVMRLRPRPRPPQEPPPPAESGVFPVAERPPEGWDAKRLRLEVLGEFRPLGKIDNGDTMTEATTERRAVRA